MLTFLVAFALFAAALALLALGWFITGKLKIRPGACGQAPDSCDSKRSCSLCDKDV